MPDTFPTKNWAWPVPVPSDDGEAIRLARGLLDGWNRMCADRDELVAALEATLSIADGLQSAYHDEGFEGACKGGTGGYATCPNCRQLDPAKALLSRIKAGK